MARMITEECIACGTCADECPEQAISESESGDIYVIDPNLCNDCANCEEVCPSDAIVQAS